MLQAIERDVQSLVSRFTRAADPSFTAFLKHWEEAKFSFVFDAGQTMDMRGADMLPEVVEALYATAKRYLQSASPTEQLCAVFVLYTLYQTQPRISAAGGELSRIPIPVTAGELRLITGVHAVLNGKDTAAAREGRQVLGWLHSHKPFRYVAWAPKSSGLPEPRCHDVEEVKYEDTVNGTIAMVQLRRKTHEYENALRQVPDAGLSLIHI
eukprot:TRINITY_DN4346_c0_g2_i7.p1 TRINITY_DN4346_c0_g2~~TRINITY_DN4346_c0_g2_i7.p1  ORF type:complete len:210 (-),score=32.99 TRINITY_DN4346_c0_g2_i7:155-784(-)